MFFFELMILKYICSVIITRSMTIFLIGNFFFNFESNK